MYWKGELNPTFTNGIGTFSSTGQFNVSGNPIYLVNGNTLQGFCFLKLFMNCTNLVDASRLILDSTTLTKYCYTNMFKGCTSLTTAPELPATNLVSLCYGNMFQGCSSLNYVKSYATDISASNCLNNWLDGVSSEGEFHKPADVDYPEGPSGIPSGW